MKGLNLGWQTSNLGAHHDEVLGEISGHEGPGLVADADDFGVGSSLRGHLLHLVPDRLADRRVDSACQPSVRGDRDVQVLGLLLLTAHLTKAC